MIYSIMKIASIVVIDEKRDWLATKKNHRNTNGTVYTLSESGYRGYDAE